MSEEQIMHDLDETCWCNPTVEIVPVGRAIQHHGFTESALADV